MNFGKVNRFCNYYETLGISPNASFDVVTQAYKERLQAFAPQQFHATNKRYASVQARRLHDAYHVLSDPALRRRFDQDLARETRLEPLPTQVPIAAREQIQWIRVLAIALGMLIIIRVVEAIDQTRLVSPFFQLIVPVLLICLMYWFVKKQNRRRQG